MKDKKWLDNYISILTIMIVVVSLCTFSTYLALSQYAYPSSDDYCFASNTRPQGFGAYQQYMYANWSGRYMATLALSAIGKLPFEHVYPFLSFAVFISTLFGFAALSAALLKKNLFSVSAWGVAVVASVVYFGQMPSIVEAFYWMSGAYTYQMGLAILVAWSALAIKSLGDNISKSERVLLYLLPVVLLGLNETTAVVFLVTLCWFGGVSYNKRPRACRLFCYILILSSLSIAVLLLAPGNAIRSFSYPALSSRHLLSFALPETAHQTLRFIKQHLPYPSLWFSGLSIWLWRRRSWCLPFPQWSHHPMVWIGIAVSLVYITLFPLYWEYGGNNLTGEGRTYNITYFCFLGAMLIAIVIPFRFQVEPNYAMLMAWPDHEKLTKNW